VGGRRREGRGAGRLCQAGSILRCSGGRELTLSGDAFSARKSILPGGRKTLVYVNVIQRSARWCTQPAFTYIRSSIVEPCLKVPIESEDLRVP
jgi:hypothetical protein